MKRKDRYILISFIVCIFVVFVFMTKNTRFESNLISCKRPGNKIQVTYGKLDSAQGITFKSSKGEEVKIPVTSKSNNGLQFSHDNSEYLIDLENSIATEVRKGETAFYQCEQSRFKM